MSAPQPPAQRSIRRFTVHGQELTYDFTPGNAWPTRGPPPHHRQAIGTRPEPFPREMGRAYPYGTELRRFAYATRSEFLSWIKLWKRAAVMEFKNDNEALLVVYSWLEANWNSDVVKIFKSDNNYMAYVVWLLKRQAASFVFDDAYTPLEQYKMWLQSMSPQEVREMKANALRELSRLIDEFKHTHH